MIAISIIKGVFNIKTNKTLYDFEVEFENYIDDALDSLSPDGDDIYSQEETELLDKLSEVGCINAINPKEATVTLQRAMSDSEATMPCEVCIHYPPSACDGKPCCICDSDNIYLNCFEDVREYRNKK